MSKGPEWVWQDAEVRLWALLGDAETALRSYPQTDPRIREQIGRCIREAYNVGRETAQRMHVRKMRDEQLSQGESPWDGFT